MNNAGLIAGLAAAITAVGAIVANWRSKKAVQAEADATLGSGWSEFATALRTEAAEEHELRLAVEKSERECKQRLVLLEDKCNRFEAHLTHLGIPLPSGEENQG